MKRTTSAVCGLSRILFAAGVFCWFFYFLVIITEPGSVSLPAAFPVLCLAVSYIAGLIASQRGMKLLVYVGIQIVICAAGIAVMQLILRTGQEAFNLRFTSSIALAAATAVCAKAAASEIKPDEIAHRFDVGLIISAVLILANHYLKGGYGKQALTVLAIAMFFLLLSLTMIRTDKNAAIGSTAGRAIPFVLLIVIALIAAAAAITASGAAGGAAGAVLTAIRWIWGLIAAAASFLWSRWVALCNWLATLIKPGEDVPVNIVVPDEQQDVPEPTEPSHVSVIVLYALTALLVAAVIAAVIYAIRRTKLKKISAGRLNNRLAVRQGGFSEGLRKAFEAAAARIRYRLDCVRFRNTPAGLLAWCERHVPRADRKLPSESGPQFLERLSEGQDAESSDALKTLSGLLEKAFYSRDNADADPALCAAVRKCRF